MAATNNKAVKEKKTKATPATVLSLKEARSRGWIVEKTEHWNSFAKVKNDLFGFIDLLCLDPINNKCIGIQTTSVSNMSARRNKIKESPIYPILKDCGIKIQLWGWEKKATNGKRQTWTVKVEEL